MFAFLRCHRDRRDERQARNRREQVGHHRWLLSWERLDDRRWLARLSCEQWHETIEEVGESRCEAIDRAEKALWLDLAHRGGRGASQRTDP